MADHYHALVWIDHREAKVFQFNATDVERAEVRSTHPHQHIHHKANSGDSGHAPLDKEFLRLWFMENCDPYKDAVLPEAPVEMVNELSRRYKEIYEMITGKRFESGDTESIEERIERNVEKANLRQQ